MSLAVLTSNLVNYNPGAGSLITLRAGTGGFALSFDQLDDNFALLMNKINDVLGVSNADTATLASTTTRVTTLEDGGLSTLIGSTKTWPHALTVTGALTATNATVGSVIMGSKALLADTSLTIGTALSPVGLQITDTYTTVGSVAYPKDLNVYGLFNAGLNHTGLSTNASATYLLDVVQGAVNATDSTKWDSYMAVNGTLDVNGLLNSSTLKVDTTAQIVGAFFLDYLPSSAGTGAAANVVWKDSNGFLRVG